MSEPTNTELHAGITTLQTNVTTLETKFSVFQSDLTEIKGDLRLVIEVLHGHEARFTSIDQRFDGIDLRFDAVDQRLNEHDQWFADVKSKMTTDNEHYYTMFDRLFKQYDDIKQDQAGVIT